MAFMLGDKGYDAAHLRLFLESQGTTPVIPNKAKRKVIFPFDAELYTLRNIIERTFCRLKDFRGIATRYDKLARNFFAAVQLAAIVDVLEVLLDARQRLVPRNSAITA